MKSRILAVLLPPFLAILAFDLLAYWTLPQRLLAFAFPYRLPYEVAEASEARIGYLVSDPELSFDIAPSHPPLDFRVGEHLTSVSSNELGCRDHHDLAAIRAAGDYIRRHDLRESDMQWRLDPHYSNRGNDMLGAWLAERLP